MKKIILILIFNYVLFCSKESIAQFGCGAYEHPPCWCQNSAYAANYCCGHDPEFTNQTADHMLLRPDDGGQNFCDNSNYSLDIADFTANLKSHWMLIWNDDFSYSKLNHMFYDTIRTATNLPIGDGCADYVISSEEIKVQNGKLVLTAHYSSDPTKENAYVGPSVVPSVGKRHFDYTLGEIQSRIVFPINSKYEAKIKNYPNPDVSWPAFWLFGDGPTGQEIDIYEITKGALGNIGEGDPERSLKMTYHYKMDGDPTSTLNIEEGIHHHTEEYLSGSENIYGLIWDRWKTQWFYNGNVVHHINKFYWTDYEIDQYYRENKINSTDEFNNREGALVLRNRHYPDGFPMPIIFGFGLRSNTTSSDVGPGKEQTMDDLKIWVRADCSENRIITSYNGQNIVKPGDGGTIIETGGNITVSSPGATTFIDNMMQVIYAASDQIGLEDGFSVDSKYPYQDRIICTNFHGFIATCEGTQDSRLTNTMRPIKTHDNDQSSIIKPNPTFYNTPSRHDLEVIDKGDAFKLTSKSGNITYVELYDMKGSSVYSNYSVNDSQLEISKNGFEPGIYTLRVLNAGSVDIKKLWIIR